MNVERLLRELETARQVVVDSATQKVHSHDLYAQLVGQRLGLDKAKELVMEQLHESDTEEGRRR